MAKYTSSSFLLHGGQIVTPGTEVELTDEQAERLGHKLTAVETGNAHKPAESDLASRNVADLKDLAASLEIEDHEGMKKAELIEAIESAEKE